MRHRSPRSTGISTKSACLCPARCARAATLVSMGCTAHWTRKEALELARRACLLSISSRKNSITCSIISRAVEVVRQQYSEGFRQNRAHDDMAFAPRPGRVQRELLQNIGVIPNVGQVRVRLQKALGSAAWKILHAHDENRRCLRDRGTSGAARQGEPDGGLGQPCRWCVTHDPALECGKFPLSNRVAQEIIAFRRELRTQIETKKVLRFRGMKLCLTKP